MLTISDDTTIQLCIVAAQKIACSSRRVLRDRYVGIGILWMLPPPFAKCHPVPDKESESRYNYSQQAKIKHRYIKHRSVFRRHAIPLAITPSHTPRSAVRLRFESAKRQMNMREGGLGTLGLRNACSAISSLARESPHRFSKF